MEPLGDDGIKIDTENKFDIQSLPTELRDIPIIDVGKLIDSKALKFSSLGGQESIGLINESEQSFFKIFTDTAVLTDDEFKKIVKSTRIDPESWTTETQDRATAVEQFVANKRGASLPPNAVAQYIHRNAMGFKKGNEILPDNIWPLKGLCVLNGKLIGFITPYQDGHAEMMDPRDENIRVLRKLGIEVDESFEAENTIIDSSGTKHYCDLYFGGKLEY